jgi:Holliday junction resolvase
MVNAKAKGSRNERECKALFEERGGAFIKAGASLGMFDLVGFLRRKTIVVQCKTNRRIGGVERRELEGFVGSDECPMPAGTVVIEAVKYDRKGWKFWKFDGKTKEWVEWRLPND